MWNYYREKYSSIRSAIEAMDKELLEDRRIQIALQQIAMAEVFIDALITAREGEETL
jgi:hypothetical protein